MRFPVASPFLNRIDRLKPSLVKGQQSFDQRQVFDFWNNLPCQQKEEILTISDDRIVKDLADSFNAFVFMGGIETTCEIESPILKLTLLTNPETRILLMDLNKLTGFSKSSCLKTLAEIYSIIITDSQQGMSQSPESQTKKNENEPSPNDAIETVLGDASLLKDRRGIVKVKLAMITNVLSTFSDIIKFFCYGTKTLLHEKSQAEIFNLFLKQFTVLLERLQQKHEEEDQAKKNGFQDENILNSPEENLQSATKVLERNTIKQQRLKLYELKTFASLLSLMFLFENRILNAFADWNLSNHAQQNWAQNHCYLVTPNHLAQQRALEGAFVPSNCWKSERNPVFEHYHGIYFGNLAFAICGDEWEEQEYNHDYSSASVLEKSQRAEQNSIIGANLRKGTPILEEILGKPFPYLIEQQPPYMNHRNFNNFQHHGIFPNFIHEVPWIGSQAFHQQMPSHYRQGRRNANINYKEKHHQYRHSDHYQAQFDRGNQPVYNPPNNLMDSSVSMSKNTKTPVHAVQFQRYQESNISSKEIQPLNTLLQKGKQNYQGQSSEQRPFKSKALNFAAPPKDQFYESEGHFELIHSTLSANVKMMRKREKNQ